MCASSRPRTCLSARRPLQARASLSEKVAREQKEGAYQSITECANLAFMGSNVISGSAVCVVVATGDDTILGTIARDLSETKKEPTTFEKGVNSVSWVLIRFMLVMVPIVLFINGVTKHDWLGALLFAISVAVGLTPEMLPMIVTTCLAKGVGIDVPAQDHHQRPQRHPEPRRHGRALYR